MTIEVRQMVIQSEPSPPAEAVARDSRQAGWTDERGKRPDIRADYLERWRLRDAWQRLRER